MKNKVLSFIKNTDGLGLSIAIAIFVSAIMFSCGFGSIYEKYSHTRYALICIKGVEYIEDRYYYTPLVPSYKPDGTINECEVSDE